ncbi:MAG TPA: CRTAC1 family protein [Terriglobales bacterium]|nr:CRTAC1 family protein [Terriglobales bacterium]
MRALLVPLLLLLSFSARLRAQKPAPPSSAPVVIQPPRLPARKKAPSPNLPPVPHFEDIAAQAGLHVSHLSAPEKRYVLESISGGIGLFDCDNDGRLDIVIVNGSTVDRYRQGGDPMVTLWHQEANGTFTDITQQAGLTRRGWGMGVAVADFDNDGNLDLYVTGYGGNVLYRNKGNCVFEDVTDKAGVRGGGFSTGAAWADYDRDGHVDLFVSRYVHFDMDHLPVPGSKQFCRYKGVAVQCGPWGMVGESDLLFHNRGDGTFEEVSKKAGVSDPDGYYGLGVEWADYDNDGWPDLFVADDSTPKYLYHNEHNGTFKETGMLLGAALDADGNALGSMGVDFADYDHSGRLSIFVSNFADQPNTLYRNLGEQGFSDVSWTSGLGQASYPLVGWGTGFFDMDNDGWSDLFVANGHVYPQMDEVAGSAPYRQPLLLYRNNRDGTFEDVAAAAGLGAIPANSRRGAAFGDIFNTGNVDVVITNMDGPPTLLVNRNQDGYHRVLFRLIGSKSNRAAIGARVTVRARALVQFDEVRGGSGYLSQNDLRLHFGLGAADSIDSVEIRWPSGAVEKLARLPADTIYTIVEGKGVTGRVALPAPAHHGS